jgi:preprotein translocase subunit SecF
MIEIIKPGTQIDFIGKWRICAAISIGILLAGAIGVAVNGVRLGLDFSGGTESQIRFSEQDTDEGAIREALAVLELEGASVVRYGEGQREFLIRFKGKRQIEEAADSSEMTAENDRVLAMVVLLEESFGALDVMRTEYVGPKVGEELRAAGLKSMGLAFIFILGYIAFRFSTRFAPGAVVALVHDVLITSSIWVVLGLEFDLRVLAALLAIVGYSLNDTIIIYDRIRENMERRTKHDLQAVLNESVNQTLSRTLLTSITTLLAVLSLLLLGGEVIRPFALAMTIGVGVGTYSSVFVAGPTLLWLESRFGGDSGAAAARGA